MNYRGERLKEYLKLKLLELIGNYCGRAEEYTYSQKEFSIYAGVSRETVRKYQFEIDIILKSSAIPKRTFDKDAKCRNLQEKNLKLQGDLVKAEAMYVAMRDQYIGIIKALLSHSIDIHTLVVRTPYTLKAEQVYRECILCNSVVGDEQTVLTGSS